MMERSPEKRSRRAAAAGRRPRRAAADPAAAGLAAGASAGPVPVWDRRTWLVAAPLALLVVAAFLPALGNGWVDWDDEVNFLRNPHYRGPGAAAVGWAWTTFWLGVYQPLAWLLLEAQSAVWKLDPRGYHLISLLLHAANAVVLYALTVTLLVRCRTAPARASPWACSLGAALATALYAVHPLRVEAVAWVSCQPYLPCALFSMLAVLAYLRAVGTGPSPRWGWLAGSLILFVAALLSHAVAVSLPAVLLILDVYPLRRLGGGPGRWFGSEARAVWWEKVPFVLLSLVLMGLVIAAREPVRTLPPLEGYGASARVAQACYGIWFYLVKTVLPLDLIATYPLPRRIDWFAPPFLLSILGTVVVSVALFLRRRRWPGLLAAWLSYLVILAPNSGLIRFGNQIAADRYSYMALLGGVVVAAAGLSWCWQELARARPAALGIIAVSLAAVLGLTVLTWDQCRVWRSSEALWTHALNHGADRSSEVQTAVGRLLARQGKDAEAAFHFNQALRLDPGFADAHNELGLVFDRRGQWEEAVAQYREALRINPDHVEAHNNLGLAFDRRGQMEEAVAQYREALRVNPGHVEAYTNLGVALARQGKYAEAAAQYAEALRLDPGSAGAYNNRAMLLAACPDATHRDGPRAVEAATRACELTGWKKPGCLDTLAAACAEAGDFDAAVTWQTKAIESLTDERKKVDFRSRLVLYQAKTPYREPSPTEVRP
jgi:tetratricopeptide (TPR) repeat protein